MNIYKKGSEYDCLPLSFLEVKSYLSSFGFKIRNVILQAVYVMHSIEGDKLLSFFISRFYVSYPHHNFFEKKYYNEKN